MTQCRTRFTDHTGPDLGTGSPKMTCEHLHGARAGRVGVDEAEHRHDHEDRHAPVQEEVDQIGIVVPGRVRVQCGDEHGCNADCGDGCAQAADSTLLIRTNSDAVEYSRGWLPGVVDRERDVVLVTSRTSPRTTPASGWPHSNSQGSTVRY
jgi:hypothetical protein